MQCDEMVIIAIQECIEKKIRPFIKEHNGDIVFKEFKEGTVYVSLIGACVSCPFSSITLTLGVRDMLQQDIPEVLDVQLVS